MPIFALISQLCSWTQREVMASCSAETRGKFERQLTCIVRGTKTLDTVMLEDGHRYKTAFESALAQSHVRIVSWRFECCARH
jgi:hypothetical protein